MEKIRLKRFNTVERISHVVLIITFLTQGASGLARMYIQTAWGKGLARVFGGYESALVVHKYVGLFMILAFLLHLVYLAFRIRWRTFPSSLMGPDSMFPQPHDVKDFFQHVAWFLGKGSHPRLDRWGYWEKVDYLGAVFWGMMVMGTTGLILAFPLISTRIIPGWGLNIALWVHRIEGMLAMGHVFIIHFTVAHLRRQNFPMDRTMFEGSADLETVRDLSTHRRVAQQHENHLVAMLLRPGMEPPSETRTDKKEGNVERVGGARRFRKSLGLSVNRMIRTIIR
ncbi:MAG: cytochrome b/b6 domain-containing protein [Deltaproteobacteria bacterium]|nr:cytochrome b/b6 domain-containing protein [Deltaproteobacteria bacterium]